ncbi:MAG: cyclic pyranopterin monophosphate synthase MoaC [Desulfobacterales bacterium]|nr:cyclic pyranopterin monophosphate synthase MoaC [Desulfobacterales bacterium]
MTDFSHIDDQGRVRMVDVTDKAVTVREAVAEGRVTMRPATLEQILDRSVKKGNVLETARIAGVMGAKKTAELIPMCHPLNLTHVAVDFFPDAAAGVLLIRATARIADRTGVEMEALTAVALAALTVYDMCKSMDRDMTISHMALVKKTGGKSGTFERAGSIDAPHP